MKTTRVLPHVRVAALGAITALTLGSPLLRAADHRDGPRTAHDAAIDLADAYLFQDPVTTGNVVLIATFHGFIVPGEAVNEAIFDPLVNYRFEIYNDHVNDASTPDPADKRTFRKFLARIKPARTIDVTFSPRTAVDGPSGLEILQVPSPQTATVKFTGFKNQPGFDGRPKKDTFTGLPVLNPTVGAASPDPTAVVSDVGTSTGVKFFAGEVDDPFFFDIPAFSRFIGRIRGGETAGAAAAEFARGRDTFAGYNVLAIALSIPKAVLANADAEKSKIGLNVVAQRRTVQVISKGDLKAAGSLKTLDRAGNPAINAALVPARRRSEYNFITPKDDAAGKFAGDIVATLTAINPGITTIGALANVAVNYGDMMILDTAASAAWPNGRKPADDVIDTALTVINNLNTLKDNVDANDVPFEAVFPYLGKTQQPRANGVLDDNTRN